MPGANISRSRLSYSLLVFAIVVALSFYESLAYRYRPAIDEACQIVSENYFDSAAIENFSLACEKAKLEFPKFLSAQAAAKTISELLSYINTSHLALFDPTENDQIWLHESLDNGIRARNIGGYAVVSEVLPKSPAEKVDIKVGDIILSVDSQQIADAKEIRGRSGLLMLLRHDFAREVRIRAEKFAEDDSLRVEILQEGVALLRVKSFLSSFFETEKLSPIINELKAFPNIIVDLRGNIGGSFPAMMRLLATFACEPELVGSLMISKRHEDPEVDLNDDLKVESQLEQIRRAQKLNLRLHEPAVCLKAHLWILIDHQTASVSEIFVDHLQQTKRARVAGQLTAGEVVMAQWFSIESLGTKPNGSTYSLSVPIADYANFKLQRIEEVGVHPDVFLEYELATALRGRDSWIDEILKMRHKQLRYK